MALKKSFTDPLTGVVGEHWSFMSITYDAILNIRELKYGLWVNEQQKQDGKLPIVVKYFQIPAGAAGSLVANVEAFSQEYVLAQSDFEDAEIV
jgi:hypothetical protein